MNLELPIRNQPIFPYKYKRFYETIGNNVKVYGKCEVTGNDYSVSIPLSEFYQYLSGIKNISEAIPSVSKEDREFLLSGTSPEGWKVLFNS